MTIRHGSRTFLIRILLLGAAAFAAGCASRVPLTKALISEYQLEPGDVTRLQLYVSDDLLLEQQITTIDKNIDSSYSLKKVEDKYIKRIRFNAVTPCIATEAESDRLKIAFEPSESLLFTLDKSNAKGEVFAYQPERSTIEERRNMIATTSSFYNWKQIGQEVYKDTTYNVLVKRTVPFLMVDMAGLRKVVVEARTVPGMRQGEEGK